IDCKDSLLYKIASKLNDADEILQVMENQNWKNIENKIKLFELGITEFPKAISRQQYDQFLFEQPVMEKWVIARNRINMTYKFSELFKKSTKKNDGQILQNHVISVANMRWGKLPKSSSEAYMKTYFIFNEGDIAYEGNRSKNYSFGRFVANDLGNGIVSHVFSVFNSKSNFNLEFLKNYINSEQVMRDPL